jgi:hypothetical protein
MEDKQRLINIMFEVALMIKDSKELQKLPNDELATWVRKQLAMCGFDTEPCGASWGILK